MKREMETQHAQIKRGSWGIAVKMAQCTHTSPNIYIVMLGIKSGRIVHVVANLLTIGGLRKGSGQKWGSLPRPTPVLNIYVSVPSEWNPFRSKHPGQRNDHLTLVFNVNN